MSNRLSTEELAAGLNLKPRRISALIKEGMPRDNLEAAKLWREERKAVGLAPIPSRLDTLDDGTLASTITRHRHLVARAQGVWETSMEEGDSNQGKYQTAYNQSLKTLINLEEEQERRALNEKVFIKRELAEASVRELAALVLARLEKVGLECAEKCNPDNPALAIKTLDAWVRSVRSDLSSDA
jgi:hypothetical protein